MCLWSLLKVLSLAGKWLYKFNQTNIPRTIGLLCWFLLCGFIRTWLLKTKLLPNLSRPAVEGWPSIDRTVAFPRPLGSTPATTTALVAIRRRYYRGVVSIVARAKP